MSPSGARFTAGIQGTHRHKSNPHLDPKKIFFNCFDLNVEQKCKSIHFFNRKPMNFLNQESDTFVRLRGAYFLPKFGRPLCQLSLLQLQAGSIPVPHYINPSLCSSIFPLNNLLVWLLHLSPVDRD